MAQPFHDNESKIMFHVAIKNLKATDLKCRHRFKEKLRVRVFFDEKKFKSDKELVGGGDVSWKNNYSFDWQQTSEHSGNFILDFIKTQMEGKFLKIQVSCQHDDRTTKKPLGTCNVDLYTLATGPVDHNLPLLDDDKAHVGRMNFSCEMVQMSEVIVMLKEIHVKNLQSTEEDIFNINPYLKYAYSKDWPAIIDGRMKGTYSDTLYKNPSPSWDQGQMPWLKFKASLNELVKESLVLHVTHKGKITNTTLGRCNLLFRTLVDGGKSFKEEDLISFKGPLNKKDSGTTIEGKLLFKHLPVFAQMKPVAGGRPAIHTEKGIYDAMPLLTWVPKPNPNIPTIRTDNPSAEVGTPKTARKGKAKGKDDVISSSLDALDINSKGKEDNREKLAKSEGVIKNKNLDVPIGDLIAFTPPEVRKRSATMVPTTRAEHPPMGMLQPMNTTGAYQSHFDDSDFSVNRETMFPTYPGNILTVQRDIRNSNEGFNPVSPTEPQAQAQPQPQQASSAPNPFDSSTNNAAPSFNPFASDQPVTVGQPSFNPFS